MLGHLAQGIAHRFGDVLPREWQCTALSRGPENLGNRVDREITGLMAVYLGYALIFVSRWSTVTRMLTLLANWQECHDFANFALGL
jgi:hypothetical protein